MAVGRHRYVQIKDGDLVYIVTTPSIAKEAVVARVNNAIYKAGGTVKMITQSLRVSGHANARELQLMINLLRPQYLFPVQGEYRDLQAHAELALEVGILPSCNTCCNTFSNLSSLHEQKIEPLLISSSAIGTECD